MSDTFENWLSKPKTEIADSNSKKEYKLDLFREVLPALDKKDIYYYQNLSAEQKASINPWMLMRWLTSCERDQDQAHYLISVNDLVNRDFSAFGSKKSRGIEGHEELQWMLLALCASGRSTRRKFIKPPKGSAKNRLEQELLDLYPTMKYSDLELLLQLNSTEDLVELFKSFGYSDSQIKDVIKNSE